MSRLKSCRMPCSRSRIGRIYSTLHRAQILPADVSSHLILALAKLLKKSCTECNPLVHTTYLIDALRVCRRPLDARTQHQDVDVSRASRCQYRTLTLHLDAKCKENAGLQPASKCVMQVGEFERRCTMHVCVKFGQKPAELGVI